MAYGKIKVDTITWDNSGTPTDITVSTLGPPEGTAVKSTNETGTTKFLRVDGDGTCSWQVIPEDTDKADKANPSFTGTVTTVNVSTDGQYIQQEETLTVSSNATTVNCSTGNYFTVQATADITFTFGTAPADTKSYAMVIEVDHNSGTLTWPNTVKWPGDAAPSLTTGKTHQFIFHTNDGGSRWRGSSLVNYTD